jgi:hypothetical protein
MTPLSVIPAIQPFSHHTKPVTAVTAPVPAKFAVSEAL